MPLQVHVNVIEGIADGHIWLEAICLCLFAPAVEVIQGEVLTPGMRGSVKPKCSATCLCMDVLSIAHIQPLLASLRVQAQWLAQVDLSHSGSDVPQALLT